MGIITVSQLSKSFAAKQKAPGLKGSIQAVFKPVFNQVNAVVNVSFEVQKGETVAFIGPNGAGKSTTIKILTGILHPSAGQATVLGYVPWQERRQLAYKIGSVFGQKPQLWYHLPPEDTFRLFARIYELEMPAYQTRRNYLVELFQIEKLMQTPVRKLSLGQRMKCEIVASLLHNPQVIFLDEPTIGLDVVAKEQIREAILHMNSQNDTTIFLTSHDVGDIEKLCKRVIIINHGKTIFDGRTSALKRKYLTHKIIDARFVNAIDSPIKLPQVTTLKQGSFGVKLQFDTAQKHIETVINDIMAIAPVQDINIADPPMEEIIREIYQLE